MSARWLVLIPVFPIVVTAQQWHKVTSIPAPYSSNYWLDVFFLPSNPQYGWVCGFNGMVIRTTNGGQSWQGTRIPGANQLESIHFVNPSVGYTSGPDGIWCTTDGGTTWTEVTPDSAFALWGCYALSPTLVMVIGGGCGSTPQRFFRSTDGGATWSFFTGTEPNSGLTDLLLYSDGTGYAVSSGRLWRTTDGGQSWAVFASSGSAVWQEEITRIGNSFLLPFAGITCSGQGNAGGMRFSTDGGTTWREFSTGRPMFGAFLLNATTGWACGYNGAAYYTSDGGQTWQLRNCGIDTTLHLDDIWFVNDTLGWVVGQGVWRYGPPERRFERDTLIFPDVCIPGSVERVVRLENRSFTQSSVTLSITGADASAFRLGNFPPNAVLASCSWTPIPLQFEPTRAGVHRAQLVATFADGTVRRLELVGIGRQRDGFPERDTLVVAAAPCGVRTTVQLPWRSRDSAAIVRIDWIGGDPNIRPESPPPLPIPRQGATLSFSILPTDTGWTEARFRVRLQPCTHDTTIVVRAYGISPILTAPTVRTYPLRCQLSQVDSIPIANTGNDTLHIPRLWIEQSPAGTITVLGWSSGRSFPIRIPPRRADTLLLLIQPSAEGPFTATVWLENNDSTKARGQKNPFRIELGGEARRTAVVSQLQSYDFGRVCVGTSREIRLRLENRGTLTAFLSQPRIAPPFAAELEDRRNPPLILGMDSVGLRIRFSPAWEGSFADTVLITATPCGERIAIAVRGEGIRAAGQFLAGRLQRQIPAAKADTLRTPLAAVGSAHLRLDRYRWDPPAPSWLRILEPPVGTWVQSGTQQEIALQLLPTDTAARYSGTLCVESDAECPTTTCIPVEIVRPRSRLRVELGTSPEWRRLCIPLDTVVTLLWIGDTDPHLPETLGLVRSVWIEPPTPAFELTGLPPLPFVVRAGELLPIRLRIQTPVEGRFMAELVLIAESSGDSLVLRYPIAAEFYRSILQLSPPLPPDTLTAEVCEAERILALPVYNSGMLTDTVLAELIPPTPALQLQSPARFALPGKGYDTILLRLSPEQLREGANHFTLRLRSLVCPGELLWSVTVIGVRPQLAVTPPARDFGSIWVGESKVDTVVLQNPSPVDVQVEAVWIEPADAGFALEGLSPLPLLLPARQSLVLPIRFTAVQSGSWQATLQVRARSVCEVTASGELRAVVPIEAYTLQLWIDRHAARPGDTLSIPLWLQGPTQRAVAQQLEIELRFDPALFFPLEVSTEAGRAPSSYDGAGRLHCTVNVPPIPDASTSRPIARLVGVVLASLPSETPIHFANVRVVAQKQTSVETRDGFLIVLFCSPGRFGIRAAPWATVRVAADGLHIQLYSPIRELWDLRLNTPDGRQCWHSRELVNGFHTVIVPTQTLASGFYVLTVRSADGSTAERFLVPWLR
ncbi:MAG: choice-of-anchor D domain-containing protein [Candidatus Kapabacteria bacterium]|nr:choice-of-anchor D domain-containing protein [Candidatus Kapabacteria bacterium]MDW8011704.1 choice-of-anchor D domain-containing protein [Bacteroidota bacterium]